MSMFVESTSLAAEFSCPTSPPHCTHARIFQSQGMNGTGPLARMFRKKYQEEDNGADKGVTRGVWAKLPFNLFLQMCQCEME